MRESLISENYTENRFAPVAEEGERVRSESEDTQDFRYLLNPRESVFQSTVYRAADASPSVLDPIYALRAMIQDRVKQGYANAKSSISFKYIFHISWATYMIVISLLGGIIMNLSDGGSFVDSWFLSVSSLANSGLTVVQPDKISKASFVASAVLMFIGNSAFLLLPTIAFRIYKLRQLSPIMDICLDNIQERRNNIAAGASESLSSDNWKNSFSLSASALSLRLNNHRAANNTPLKLNDMLQNDALYIQQYRSLYHGSIAMFVTVVVYIMSWVCFGALFLTLALTQEKQEDSLHQRGFTYFQNGLYLTLSAFSNSGLSLSGNTFLHENTNAACLVVAGLIVLAGNIFLPVFLRWYLVAGEALCRWRGAGESAEAFQWTLRNPRRVTTHVFLASETNYLAQFSVMFNVVVFVLFMSVEVYRHVLMDEYGPRMRAVGLGVFQIINLRHSGFTSIAMTDLTQSTLLVFCLAMYLSPLPFIGLLVATGEQTLRQVQGKAPTSSSTGGSAALLGVARQVMAGSWAMKFALLFILVAFENDLLNDNPQDVNLWFICFELVSAYGLVGLSVGTPNSTASLSGSFSTGGKVCVTVAALMGKHRGLPHTTDPIIDFDFYFLKDVLVANYLPGGVRGSEDSDAILRNDELLKSLIGNSNYELNGRSSLASVVPPLSLAIVEPFNFNSVLLHIPANNNYRTVRGRWEEAASPGALRSVICMHCASYMLV